MCKMDSEKGEGQHVLLLRTSILDRGWAAILRGRTLSLFVVLRNARQQVHLPAAPGGHALDVLVAFRGSTDEKWLSLRQTDSIDTLHS